MHLKCRGTAVFKGGGLHLCVWACTVSFTRCSLRPKMDLWFQLTADGWISRPIKRADISVSHGYRCCCWGLVLIYDINHRTHFPCRRFLAKKRSWSCDQNMTLITSWAKHPLDSPLSISVKNMTIPVPITPAIHWRPSSAGRAANLTGPARNYGKWGFTKNKERAKLEILVLDLL